MRRRIAAAAAAGRAARAGLCAFRRRGRHRAAPDGGDRAEASRQTPPACRIQRRAREHAAHASRIARNLARARQRRHRGRLLARRRGRSRPRAHRARGRCGPEPAEQFTPAPPTDIRRGSAPHARRRGFPAGRAARVPRQGRTGSRSPPPAPRIASGRELPEEAPRRGLLQRLISRARRSQEPEAPSPCRRSAPRTRCACRQPELVAAGQRFEPATMLCDEQSPLPVLFNRQRKLDRRQEANSACVQARLFGNTV